MQAQPVDSDGGPKDRSDQPNADMRARGQNVRHHLVDGALERGRCRIGGRPDGKARTAEVVGAVEDWELANGRPIHGGNTCCNRSVVVTVEGEQVVSGGDERGEVTARDPLRELEHAHLSVVGVRRRAGPSIAHPATTEAAVDDVGAGLLSEKRRPRRICVSLLSDRVAEHGDGLGWSNRRFERVPRLKNAWGPHRASPRKA
ncbi:hypothetical protein D9M72_494580 [compost metagenome]